MLSEHHCRVLRTAADFLMRDFDASQAAIFMEVCGVFTADQAKMVEDQHTSLERLRVFLRIFTRYAHDLESLLAYVREAKQPDLEDFLKKALENHHDHPRQLAGNRYAMSPANKKRLLTNGLVPSVKNLVPRLKLCSETVEKLGKLDQHDSFFLVLHGLAGSGKTSLAAWILNETDLLGTSFDHVYFLTDSRTEPSQVNNLYSDLLVMLTDSRLLTTHIDMSTACLRRWIADALIDHPNSLIVLDDVTQAETVFWADHLRLRVLAATRNKCLFNAATAPVEVIDVGGFNLDETRALMVREGLNAADGNIKANKAVEMAHNATSGNPALLAKMARAAGKRHEQLQLLTNKLARPGLSTIKYISPYRYASLYEPFAESVASLGDREQMALACAAVMPANHWVPLEVWAMVVPVDVCDSGDIIKEIRVQLQALHDNGAWLEESEDGEAFRVPSIVSTFLREDVHIRALRECYARLETGISNSLRCMSGGDCLHSQEDSLLFDYFTANAPLYGVRLPGSAV